MKNRWIILALVGLASLTVIPLPNDYRARWTSFLLDATHVPLMAAAVLLTAQLVRLRTAIFVVGSSSLLLEASQGLLSSRTFSYTDLEFNALGIVLGAVLVVIRGSKQITTIGKLMFSLLFLLLALIRPALHCGPYLVDAYNGVRHFPLVAEFSSGPNSLCRWYDPDGRITRELTHDGESVGVFEIHDDNSAILLPIVRDWSSATSLFITYQAKEAGCIDISVRDGKKIPDGMARHFHPVSIQPGRHTIEVDLTVIAKGGRFAPVDLTRVQSFHFYVDPSRENRSGTRFQLFKVWLE